MDTDRNEGTESIYTHDTGEYQALAIPGAIIGLIVAGVLYVVIIAIGPPPLVSIYKQLWFVIVIVITVVFCTWYVNKDQKEANRYLKDQTKERQELAHQLGLDYQNSKSSDNPHSSGVISGEYRQRYIRIDSGLEETPSIRFWFTEIETKILGGYRKSFSLWMRNDHLHIIKSGEYPYYIEFECPIEDVASASWLLSESGLKDQLLELGAYHLDAYDYFLIMRFIEGRPSRQQLKEFIDLTIDVAEKIESAPKFSYLATTNNLAPP